MSTKQETSAKAIVGDQTSPSGGHYEVTSEGTRGVLVSKDRFLAYQSTNLCYEPVSQKISVVMYVSRNYALSVIRCDDDYSHIPDYTAVSFIPINGIATQVKPI